MKTYFNDQGCLMIEAEDNTEMVALEAWLEEYKPNNGETSTSSIVFDCKSHLRAQAEQALKGAV
jgi:hypothetical protein